MQILAQPAGFRENLPAEKDRGLVQADLALPPGDQVLAAIKAPLGVLGVPPVKVPLLRVAENHVAGRIAEQLAQGRERAWEILVVGVQPADDFSARLFEALVERVRLPAILFGNPVEMRMPAQDFQRPIGGAGVENQVLEVVRPLREDGLDGTLDESALVVGRRDHGKIRRAHSGQKLT